MDTDTDHPTLHDNRPIADIAVAACRLAGRRQIRAVHVVSRQRPTYDELLRVRRCASKCGVELTADASGVSFRRAASPVANSAASPVWQWLHAHGRTWRAGHTALNEGTR
jgi:hypothetical protein